MSKHKGKVPTKPDKQPAWTPFERMEISEEYVSLMSDVGGPDAVPDEVWVNSRYQVLVTYYKPDSFMADKDMPYPFVSHLSIKRHDRKPVTDWRDKQRLKNEILGPEIEAVEVYPAESRLVDSSNQYHLFALPPGFKFPFGYKERAVASSSVLGATNQRPFEPGQEPPDAIDSEPLDPELAERLRRLRDAGK